MAGPLMQMKCSRETALSTQISSNVLAFGKLTDCYVLFRGHSMITIMLEQYLFIIIIYIFFLLSQQFITY